MKKTFSIIVAYVLIACFAVLAFPALSADGGELEPIIQSDGMMDFDMTFESSVDCSDKLDKVVAADSFTVACRFYQDNSDKLAQSLFSVSNSQQAVVHFHLYVDGARLGYELRYNSAKNINAYADVLLPNGINSVAFVADKQDNSFKLYANGELVHTQSFEGQTFPTLGKLTVPDSVRIGATDRVGKNSEYPFRGRIADLKFYDMALGEESCIEYTSYTPAATVDARVDNPFTVNEFGTNAFRIPCLTTLQNGNVIAAADLRGSGLDSPENIEIGVRVLDKKTNTWGEPVVALEFEDWERGAHSKASASYIDAAILQVESGRIFLIADAMPAATGGGTGNGYNGMVKIGDKQYYALTTGDATSDEGYEYYLFPNPDSKNEYDKYLIKKVSDSSDTEYTADGKMCLYKNGEPLFVKQQPNNTVDVPMSVFYERSVLQLYHTTYWALTYSDDNGLTWSDPVLVGSEYRQGEKYFARCPGLGYQIKGGEYKGRILFPTYTAFGETDITVSMLYSDDGGVTWSMGEKLKMNRGKYKDENGNVLSLDPGYGCESQVIELPDGTLRVFSRTSSKYIGYADSIDGGVTFEPLRNDFGLDYCGDCMISVINYSQKIDGCDALIISYPERRGRYDGRIKIGLIKENEGFDEPAYGRYTIEWKYKYEINNGVFWYSCLAELDDHSIAYLYEPGTFLIYGEVGIENIKGSGNFDYSLKNISSDASLFKIALKFDEKIYSEFSSLEDATLVATGADGTKITLEYSCLSEDGRTVFFEGEVYEFENGYSYTVAYSPDNDLMTLAGPVDPSSVGPVTVEYQAEIPTEESTTETTETTEEKTEEKTEVSSEETTEVTEETTEVTEETTDETTEATEESTNATTENTEEESQSSDGGKNDGNDVKILPVVLISGAVGAIIGAALALGISALVALRKKKK